MRGLVVGLFVVLSALSRPLLATYKSILPRPRQIEYGSGRLPLRGVSVGFGFTPGPEDKFAANELASALSRMAGTTVRVIAGPVLAGHPHASAIALVRTGPVDALPGPDDHAGPDSREAYEIRINSRGAEIRARSSAGLYYGVQTMRQMVDGDSVESFLPQLTPTPRVSPRGEETNPPNGRL